MRFDEMCIKLFDNDYKMAYRRGWGDISTTVRVVQDKRSKRGVLTYFDLNEAKIPVIVTKDTVDSDDWVCTNELSERFSIKEFMKMPSAKEFLKDIHGYINGTGNLDVRNISEVYKLRMDEAVKLRLMHVDFAHGKLMMTDIGYDLVKQI